MNYIIKIIATNHEDYEEVIYESEVDAEEEELTEDEAMTYLFREWMDI